jgi:hypothetical protein
MILIIKGVINILKICLILHHIDADQTALNIFYFYPK